MVSVGSRIASAFLVGLATVAAAGAAQAQSNPSDERTDQDNPGVRTRTPEGYESVGIPAGGFRLYPRVGAAAEWNDNVFTDTTGGVDDMSYTLSAGARLVSGWGRHYFALEGSVQDTAWVDIEEDVDPVWAVGAEGRLDILRGFTADGSVSYLDTFEARGSNNPSSLAEPVHYTEFRAGGRISREFNRLRLSGGGNFSEQDYDDGMLVTMVPVDQDFRDRNTVEISGRIDYAISPDTALFTSVSQRWHDYSEETFGNRDFWRRRALVGAAFDLTNVVRGEIGVGYSWAEYDVNTGAEDPDGFTMTGSVDWFLTRLTTVNFAAERDLGDSGDPAAPSRLLTDVGVRVDHELYRNIIVWARGGWAEEDYNGAPPYERSDEVTSASLGCDWLVNRYAAVQARYTRTERDSEGLNAFRDYEQNRFMLGLTLRR